MLTLKFQVFHIAHQCARTKMGPRDHAPLTHTLAWLDGASNPRPTSDLAISESFLFAADLFSFSKLGIDFSDKLRLDVPDPVRQRTKSDPGTATPGLLPSHASPERLPGSRDTPDPSVTTPGTPGSLRRHLGRGRGLTNQSGAKACEQRPLCRPAREGSTHAHQDHHGVTSLSFGCARPHTIENDAYTQSTGR